MILEIQHETRLTYAEPVSEAVTELRMEPVSGPEQSCRSFHLRVSPAAEVFRYQDGFGNRVHHFNLIAAPEEVCILSASVVETHPNPVPACDCGATWPLALEGADLMVFDFLAFRGPVRPTPLLGPVLQDLKPREGEALGRWVESVRRYIHERYEYARYVTLASSPIDDVLSQGKGVCQDFTHLMLAVLRWYGVPARYISGYVHRPGKESQSHAWGEAWLPGVGWVGLDPTNDRAPDEHFIKVAIGRDFTDVPPNKGTYRGRAQEAIAVRVETRELERLPPLSWQDQLPALHTPLTAIRPSPRHDVYIQDGLAPQQQQQ
jgi:transglutaminase-like putative cysteine protease